MRKLFFPLFFAALTMTFLSCEEDDNNPITISPDTPKLYVVDGLSETISAIDLANDSVYQNIDTTGIWPGEMEYHNGWLYLVNGGSNTLQKTSVIDLGQIISYYTFLGYDRNPVFFEIFNGHFAAISNWKSGTVSFLELNTGVLIEEVFVGAGAWDILFYEDRFYVGVSNYDFVNWSYGSGQLVVIDDQNFMIDTTLNIGVNPGPMFIDQQGELNVVCIGDYFTSFGQVYRIDPDDDTIIGSFNIGGSTGYAAMDNAGIVYLSGTDWLTNSSYILTYDSNTESVIHGAGNPILISGESNTGYMGMAFDSEGSLYVCCFNSNHVVKIDGTGQVLETYDMGDGAGPQSLVYVQP